MGVIKFFQPQTLQEAMILLDKYKNSKVLAGGTDLALNLRRGDLHCDYIVSLENILDLKFIVENRDEVIIGARTTFDDMLKNKVIQMNFNSLINCSNTMGSPQIRNIATLGGNIINAGAAADAIPCLIILGGILVIESLKGRRLVLCENYFNDYIKNKIKEDEILISVIIPKIGYKNGYYKLGKRNSLAIARLSTGINMNIVNDKIQDIRICLGAVGRHPFRVTDLEKEALKKDVRWLFSNEAINYLGNAVEKSIGGRKTMVFKREAVGGVFKNAVNLALGDMDIGSERR